MVGGRELMGHPLTLGLTRPAVDSQGLQPRVLLPARPTAAAGTANPYPVSRMALVRLAQATAEGWRPSTRRS